MPFVLVLGPCESSPEAIAQEWSFDQPLVRIGRAADCDVFLRDPIREVSSRHAEIRTNGDRVVLIDTGSTNGTSLNEKRILAGKEYALHSGDGIRIGSFALTYRDVKGAAVRKESVGGPHAAAAASDLQGENAQAVDRLVYLLRRSYPEMRERVGSDEGCGPGVAELLHRNLDSVSKERAAEIIRAIQNRFRGPASDRRSTGGSPPKSSLSPIPTGSGADAESFPQLLCAVATRYCPAVEDLSPEIAAKILARMVQILGITFKSLADALKGRREFQRELEVDATRILSWSRNPIKSLETEEEIGHVLLDPYGGTIPDERLDAQLREVFQDLLLHQIGLLAGMQECLRGLLKEFAPSAFETEGGGRTVPKASSFSGRAQVKRNSDAWEAFRSKHQKFSEEEVKLFETLLAPYFVQGYLAVQKTKRPA